MDLSERNYMKIRSVVLGLAQFLWTSLSALVTILLAFWLVLLTLSFCSGLSNSDIASWVQAVGAIFAIWGAFRIGNMQHVRELERRKEEAREEMAKVKEVMARLAQGIDFHVGFLYQAVSEISEGQASLKLNEYLMSGYDLRWPHQLSALQTMDIRNLTSTETMLLADLKTACSFSIRLCDLMAHESAFMAKRENHVLQLMRHRADVRAAYIILSPSGWEISPL